MDKPAIAIPRISKDKTINISSAIIALRPAHVYNFYIVCGGKYYFGEDIDFNLEMANDYVPNSNNLEHYRSTMLQNIYDRYNANAAPKRIRNTKNKKRKNNTRRN